MAVINAIDETKADKNEIPTIPDIPEQVQSDWNQTDETTVDFIKNKPKELTEEDAIALAMETGLIESVATASGEVLVDKNNTVITL